MSSDIYYLASDSHSYLNYTSTHPVSCKEVIPISQFLQHCHVCSQDEVSHSRISEMFFLFRKIGFPSTVLDQLSLSFSSSLLLPSPSKNNRERESTFHSTSLHIQHIIHYHSANYHGIPPLATSSSPHTIILSAST